MEKKLMTGELTRAAGVTRATLRYYERIGILPEPGRTASGYRQYPNDAVGRLRFVSRAQELGFTLAEIVELLELRVADVRACGAVQKHATAKLAAVEAKIADLTQIAGSLTALIAQCESLETTDECPILDTLGGDY